MKIVFRALFFLAAWAVARADVVRVGGAVKGLVWDTTEQTFNATPRDVEALFQFQVTNRTDQPVEIRSTATSCHCTVAKPPRQPWSIPPGGSDTLLVRVDLLSRRGALTKTIYVDSSLGEVLLLVHVNVPPPAAVLRESNVMAARANRQAVLHGDCASCHVAPTVNLRGKELFTAACLICHGGPNRASMVPDLTVAKTPRDAAYWDKWIRGGGEGTLMPAFAKTNDGSLDDAQIASLVEFLVRNLPTQPAGK
jgi:cytochrome c5